jgi:hypothetical protein
MAYMDREKKAQIAPVVMAICKRHGVKATVAVRHHSTLVLNIAEGRIDFMADRVADRFSPEVLASQERTSCLDVNPYHWRSSYTGAALAFFAEVFPALNAGNHNNSDSITDYSDVGWYVDVNVGRWGNPYRVNPALVADWFTECQPAPGEEPDPRYCTSCGRERDLCGHGDEPGTLPADPVVQRPPAPAPVRPEGCYCASLPRSVYADADSAAPLCDVCRGIVEKLTTPVRPGLRLVHPEPEYLTIPRPFQMYGCGIA